jgi:hypothetical protein
MKADGAHSALETALFRYLVWAGRLGGARVVPTRSGWRAVDAENLPGEARACGCTAAWDKPRSGQNAGLARDAWR